MGLGDNSVIGEEGSDDFGSSTVTRGRQAEVEVEVNRCNRIYVRNLVRDEPVVGD
jgi:hypothetical protein